MCKKDTKVAYATQIHIHQVGLHKNEHTSVGVVYDAHGHANNVDTLFLVEFGPLLSLSALCLPSFHVNGFLRRNHNRLDFCASGYFVRTIQECKC